MTPSSRVVALVATAIAFLVATTAHGQQDVDTQVRALMRDGEKAVAEQRFADAEGAYEKAFKLKPGFDVAANLADTERKLDKPAEAAQHYAFAIRTYPSSFNQKVKKSLQTALAEMQTKVATVEVTVSHELAVVRVDGSEIGKAPLLDPLFLTPGSHTVEAKLDDMSASQSVTAEAGAKQSITLQLIAPSPSNGETSPHPMPALLITGAVLAVAGIGVGIGLTVASFSKADEADELLQPFLAGQRCSSAPADCDAIDSALGASDDLATGAAISFVAGGVFAAATLTYWLASPSGGAQPESAILLPFIAPSAAGATLIGTF